MAAVRNLPTVVHRTQERLVDQGRSWASTAVQVAAESGRTARQVRAAAVVDGTYDLAASAVETQRGLANALLVATTSTSELLREQISYQARIVTRTVAAGRNLNSDRATASRQTAQDNFANLRVAARRQRGALVQTTMHTVEALVETISAGARDAADIARMSVADARDTVVRQRALAAKISRDNLEATRVGLRLASSRPDASDVSEDETSQVEHDEVDYSRWLKSALIEEASKRGLATSGTVRDLRKRLSTATS